MFDAPLGLSGSALAFTPPIDAESRSVVARLCAFIRPLARALFRFRQEPFASFLRSVTGRLLATTLPGVCLLTWVLGVRRREGSKSEKGIVRFFEPPAAAARR